MNLLRRHPTYQILLFLLILALSLIAVPAQAQETGSITGQVTMGDGALPEGLEVELLFLPNGQGPPVITSQPLEGDGLFRFTDLDSAPEHAYLVRVKVEEEDNYSDLLTFTAGESTKEVLIGLFERTTDASNLLLQEISYILDLRPEGWLVLALYGYQNSGEQTIVNLTNPPAFIPLPGNASNVQFGEEIDIEQISELPDGFAYSGPFAPGEMSFIFTYLLPYSAGEQTLTLPLSSASQGVRVLVPELGQTTTTDELTSGGQQEFQGFLFEIFEADDPTSTESVTLSFSGLPPAPTPSPQTETGEFSGNTTAPQMLPISPLENLPWWTPLGPMVVAGLSVLGYLVYRPAPTIIEQRATLRKERDKLVAEIAMLDIRFESGGIGEQTHRRQRKQLKAQLKEVLRGLGTGDEESDA